MQTTKTTQAPATAADSGFAPIPTRMQDLAPLVVGAADENRTLVAEQLESLESQLAHVHAIAAEAYLSQSQWEKARVHIEASVACAPEEMRYLNQCGYLRYLCGDDAGAMTAFEKVVEHLPTQVDALCNLGMVCFGLERFAEARRWFALAAQQAPEDAEIWNNLGAAIFHGGEPPVAAAYFRRALEIDPGNEDAKANLAAC